MSTFKLVDETIDVVSRLSGAKNLERDDSEKHQSIVFVVRQVPGQQKEVS